jgi:RecA/RadA recombinase
MAKEKEEKIDGNAQSRSVLSNLLNKNKTLHWQFHENKRTNASMGSLFLDAQVNLTEGIQRFCGPAGSGKTSEATLVIKNFLEGAKNRKALWVKAEGRLSDNIIKRSGIKFVFTIEEWEYGTCFVLESNVFEFICDTIKTLVNVFDEADDRLAIVIDSADGLRLEADDKKELGDEKVAGPQLIMKRFLTRMIYPIVKSGTICIITSQVTSTINTTGSKEAPKLVSGGGGNALIHYANYILDFQPRWWGDNILQDGPDTKFDAEKNPIIGHWASIVIKKTDRENELTPIKYPIKHGRDNGQSIWVEYEILHFGKRWGLIEVKGTWLAFEPKMLKDAQDKLKKEFKPQLQGTKKLLDYLEENQDLTKYLFDRIRAVEAKS